MPFHVCIALEGPVSARLEALPIALPHPPASVFSLMRDGLVVTVPIMRTLAFIGVVLVSRF